MDYYLSEEKYNEFKPKLDLDYSREAINEALDVMDGFDTGLDTDSLADQLTLVKAVDTKLQDCTKYHIWDLVEEHKDQLSELCSMNSLVENELVKIDRNAVLDGACESMYTYIDEDKYIHSEILYSVQDEIQSEWDSMDEDEQSSFYEHYVNEVNDDLHGMAAGHFDDPNLAVFAAYKLEDQIVDADAVVDDVLELFESPESYPEGYLDWDMEAVQDDLLNTRSNYDDYYISPVLVHDAVGEARVYVEQGEIQSINSRDFEAAKEAVKECLAEQVLEQDVKDMVVFDLESIGQHYAEENGYNLVNEEHKLYAHPDQTSDVAIGIQDLGHQAIDNANTLADLPEGSWYIKGDVDAEAEAQPEENFNFAEALENAYQQSQASKGKDMDRDR